MSVINQPEKPVVRYESRVYQKIMSRVRRALLTLTALALVLVIINAIAIAMNNELVGRVDTLESMQDRVARQLDTIVDEITSASSSSFARNYNTLASEASLIGSNISAFREAQINLLRVFDDLIERNPSRYQSIAYITRDERVWGLATNISGQVLLTSDARRILPEDQDPEQRAYIEQRENTELAISAIKTLPDGTEYVSIYAPIRDPNETYLRGIVRANVYVSAIVTPINEINGASAFSRLGRRLIVADNTGRVLGSSTPFQNDESIVQMFANQPAEVDTLIDSGGVYSASQLMSYTGANMPWRIIIEDELITVLGAPVVRGLLTLAAFIALMIVIYRILDNAVKTHLNRVSAGAGQARGMSDITTSAEADEIDMMIAGMDTASRRISDLTRQIEREVRRRNRDIEIAARIGRETATLTDIDTLLNRTIQLITTELGFYHAQVFLVDEARRYAVLVYSHGEAGRQLLARGHKIAIGTQTVIGQVTSTAKPVIVNNTTTGKGKHGFNALLAATRAEMGLPLIIGQEVIGVLDIQSAEENVFHEEDLAAYELLADQLAVAINKANLLAESQRRIEEIDRLNRQLTRDAWQDANLPEEASGYRYDLMKIEPASAHTAHTDGFEVPITVRGEMIGSLTAQLDSSKRLSEGDKAIMRAVSDRVALALENARLFRETQSALSETSGLYQLTRYLNEASTLPDVLQAIIVSSIPDADGGQVWIFEDYEVRPEVAEVRTDLVLIERAEEDMLMVGRRIRFTDHPFLTRMPSNAVTIINDVSRDNRLDYRLKDYLQRLNATSALLIPLNVRGEWVGLILIIFEEKRSFSEREGRLFSGIIDQAGIAIDNRLLLEQTELALQRNENLYAASRIINQAQSLADLVRAVAVTQDTNLNFHLALLEGELDETGWPTQARLIATAHSGVIEEHNFVQEMSIPEGSPIRRRQPEIIAERARESGSVITQVPLHDGERDGFVAIYPLFSANQPIALFYLTARANHTLSNEDDETYRALTGQMSTQIENRRLLERTERALDETRRLYLASRAIAGAPDMDEIFSTAVDNLAAPLNEQTILTGRQYHIAVMLAQPQPYTDAEYLQCAHTWTNGSGKWVRMGDFVDNQDQAFPAFLQQIDTLLVPDLNLVNASGPAVEIMEWLNESSVRSSIFVPISVRGLWFGVMVIASSEPKAFTEQYARYADAIAGQVALALENQRLFREAQNEAQRAQQEAQRALALAEAAQLASTVSTGGEADEATMLDNVLARIVPATGYDRWLLALMNERGTALETIVYNIERVRGEEEDEIRSYPLDMPNFIPMAAVQNTSYLVNSMGEYDAIQSLEEPRRSNMIAKMGKFVVSPVGFGGNVIGALLAGRGLDTPDLDEGDVRLVNTLAAQVAVAIENRRLFEQAAREQKTLSSILSTLPAAVLVLNPETLQPTIYNDQAIQYLGQFIDQQLPFNAENYQLYRTGTDIFYSDDELPVTIAHQQQREATVDDIAIITPNGSVDLLMNAAPIYNERGGVNAIVATFSDISNLRSLEATLQENLRETIAVYEAQRQLTQADELESVMNVLDVQLTMMQPSDAYVLMADARDGSLYIERMLVGAVEDPNLFSDALLLDRLLYITDVQRHDFAADIKKALLTRGVRSMISVPLRTRTREYPLGWLVITGEQAAAFTPEQERIMLQLGDVASTAIDNRLLIRSTREALEETDQLYRATTNISRSRVMEDLIEAIDESLKSFMADIYGMFTNKESLVQEVMIEQGDETALLRAALARHSIPSDGLFISDLHTLEPQTDLERDLKIAAGEVRALAVVSYRIKGSRDGRLIVGYLHTHDFNESDKRLLSAMTESASVVLDNISLVEEIQMTLEETTTLYQAARAMSDATDAQGVMRTIVDYIAQPHVDQVMVISLKTPSWNSPKGAAVVSAFWSRHLSSRQDQLFEIEKFPLWDQIASPHLLIYDDVRTDEELTPIERISFENYDARSVVIIPLRVPNHTIGAIWISSTQPHHHQDAEMRVFQSFGEQASLSLEALHLIGQTERRARQMETTAEVSSTAGQILDLEVLLPRIVHLIRDAFGYDHTQIFLMDESGEYAMLRASTGEAGRMLLRNKHRLQKGSQSVIGQVTQNGVYSVAMDTAESGVIHRPNIYLPLTRSELALPLFIKGKIVGALDVQSNVPNAFSDEDVSALTTLAAQISIAIDNANLYQDSQNQANRMALLFDITTAAAFAGSSTEALNNVATYLQTSQNAHSVAVYLKYNYVDRNERPYSTLELAALASQSDADISQYAPVRIDAKGNLLAEMAREMQSLVIDDIEREPNYVPVIEGARAAVLAPLVSGADLLGMIVMEGAEVYAFQYDELQLLLTLAGSLSAIVQSTQLLEQLQTANDELRELDRIKSDFLANMSHELRTPLNSIIGFSRVMLKGIDGPLTEMQEQDLTTIYNGGQHLLALINDILDQAKIAAGKMDIKPNLFEIKSVIDVVKSMAIGYMKDKSLQLYVEVEPNLPKVYADEIRLRQVLINLVSNAIKFTNDGAVTLRVYRYTDPNNGRQYVRTDVIDTGIGIAEKDLPLLFEAFRQVDSSLTRTAGGTGLGLPIAKSLIEMMGGEMTVDSQVNVGSTFSVIVPTEPTEQQAADAKREQEEEEARLIEQHAEQTTRGNGRAGLDTKETRSVPRIDFKPHQMAAKRQILLIEDNPDMVDQFRRTLQREGFEVLAASIPLEAEAMASGLHPTIIVMDVNFAKGQGWEILKRLKERDDTFDIPVIVVTLSSELERAREMGAADVIQRPFMPETLAEAAAKAEKEANTERILIIDDQPESVRLLRQLLDAHGQYRVFAANSGQEGISLVARRRPDLVILDLRMPEMDGFAVLHELRSNPETSNIPVMVVTGDIDLSSEELNLLEHVRVLQKAGISETAYQEFVERVQGHLSGGQ